MELGKHVKGEKSGKCSDRISSLPDELLAHILSCLPTTSAVSTCILSKRWRCLFTLTNCLSFDDAPCYDVPITAPLSFDEYYEYDGELCYDAPFIKDTKQARVIRFKKFVNNVLELHQVSPIEKFSIVCRYAYESELNAWFSMAVRKGVQDLYCRVGKRRDGQRLREFTCQTLVRLKMIGHDNDLGIPLSARLPSLKVLHLEAVAFFNNDDFSVERFFSGCKVLEELTLKNCVASTFCHIVVSSRLLKILTMESCSIAESSFEIDVPNLARLSYKDCSGVKIIPSWKDSCSLAKAELSFCSEEGLDSLEYCSDEFKYDGVLIKAAADKVTELHLMSNILELLGNEQMPVFRSLSRFQLCDCPFNAWKSVSSLLENSPQLETVTFHRCSYDYDHNGDPTVTHPNEDLTPFSCHAEVIEVYHFYGCEYSLLYLGHLLCNARVLERLILHRGNISNKTQVENAMDMLRLLPRASKECCILLA